MAKSPSASDVPTIIKLCEFCQRPFHAPKNKPWIRYCSTACDINNADLSDYAPPLCDNGCGKPARPKGHYCGDECKREATLKRQKTAKVQAPTRQSWKQKPGGEVPPEVMELHALALEFGPSEAADMMKTTRSAIIGRLWRYNLSPNKIKNNS